MSVYCLRITAVLLQVLLIHYYYYYYYYYWWGETESLGTAATTGLLYQPQMTGDGDCEEIGGI
jgi:hypothetical protein